MILTGVRDTELVQELIPAISDAPLADVVKQCYAFEASRSSASKLASSPAAVRATSQYKRDKTKSHAKKIAQSNTQPPDNPCDSCRRVHDAQRCPAYECSVRELW